MVNIAIAGGSGHIAREIINVLVATQKHNISILSRRDPTPAELAQTPGISWIKADYTNKATLTKSLEGIHTILSFIVAHHDHGSVAQKALIDAAIAAGVKRFAPNEWSGSTIEALPWYAEKQNVRDYLADLNKDKQIIEYTLFQPGFIADYLVPVGSSTKYLQHMDLWIDFPRRRAIRVADTDAKFTVTTMRDLAQVVAAAMEHEGVWPVVGGVHGITITEEELVDMGVKARGGKPWDVTYLREEDVRNGNINTAWMPRFKDPSLTEEQLEYFSKAILKGSLLSGLAGSWVVNDAWNKLVPGYEFEDLEAFLVKHWAGME